MPATFNDFQNGILFSYEPHVRVPVEKFGPTRLGRPPDEHLQLQAEVPDTEEEQEDDEMAIPPTLLHNTEAVKETQKDVDAANAEGDAELLYPVQCTGTEQEVVVSRIAGCHYAIYDPLGTRSGRPRDVVLANDMQTSCCYECKGNEQFGEDTRLFICADCISHKAHHDKTKATSPISEFYKRKMKRVCRICGENVKTCTPIICPECSFFFCSKECYDEHNCKPRVYHSDLEDLNAGMVWTDYH